MKKLLTLAFCIISFISFSQENLVPNPSFEETGKSKVKEKGQIELAEPWSSATTVPVDLYMEEAKDDEYAVPENVYGKEKPKTGKNYAGISFFGYRGRMPRSYLQTELTDTLEAGKEYCMKFHVSMSDLSKYSVNNLGMYVSKGEVESKGSGTLNLVPQIKNLRNRIFDKQFLWEPICGIYKAEGGETHIVIGNFNSDEETQNERVRLSREFSGPAVNNGYYYIDDVSVTPINNSNREDCMCEKIAGGALKVESKTFGTEEEKRASAKTTYILNSDGTEASKTINQSKKDTTAAPTEISKTEKVEPTKTKTKVKYNVNDELILFSPKSTKLSETAKADLDKLYNFLSKNKSVKVEIQGHADPSETEVAFIGKRRAFEVVKYLADKGIDRTQIPYKSYETQLPLEEGNVNANARVTFQIK